MREWWTTWSTYTLSDFLLFSARTYRRLFELYNGAVWPLQAIALVIGAIILVCLWRGGATCGRIASALLAACWLWVGWVFHAQYYATINWAANYFAIGFVAEALLLAWFGIVRAGLSQGASHGATRIAGGGVFLFALLVQPLLGLAAERPWMQVELFGVAPDPTAAATLGAVLLASPRPRWSLLAIPLVWCGIAGATLWTMKENPVLLLPLLVPSIALLVVVLAAMTTRTSGTR